MEALVLARAGRLQAAERCRAAPSTRPGVRDTRKPPHVRSGARRVECVLRKCARGPAARRRSARAVEGRDAQYAAAVALALAGDVTQSQPLAADLEKRYPEDTSVQSSYLPTLRALFSLHAGQSSQAIEQLQPARQYEFADPAINFLAYFGGLYPVYVRGEAYLATHQGAEAAAEFQKILDHRGLVLGDPMGARARLEMARAWALAGDRAKARAAYEDFIALWKDADPDIPIFRQARAEYAKLQYVSHLAPRQLYVVRGVEGASPWKEPASTSKAAVGF